MSVKKILFFLLTFALFPLHSYADISREDIEREAKSYFENEGWFSNYYDDEQTEQDVETLIDNLVWLYQEIKINDPFNGEVLSLVNGSYSSLFHVSSLESPSSFVEETLIHGIRSLSLDRTRAIDRANACALGSEPLNLEEKVTKAVLEGFSKGREREFVGDRLTGRIHNEIRKHRAERERKIKKQQEEGKIEEKKIERILELVEMEL
ncbi:hypothetical protein ACFLX2_00030 [Candidatus Dependentiae bacterium]